MFVLKYIVAIIFVTYQYFTIPVVQDPGVRPPLARADLKKKTALIIQISKDGAFAHDGKKISADQLTELCKKHIEKHPNGVLHLRGDKGTSFKHVRTVIRSAAKVGLDSVVFSVSGIEKADEEASAPETLRQAVEKTIKSNEQDLKMQLPAAAPDHAPPAIAPFFIGIGSKGEVWINTGPAKEIVETNVLKRNLPTLRARLKTYSAVAKAAGQKPVVQIWADKAAKQVRVVDVLNALASEKISKVTFTDPVDE